METQAAVPKWMETPLWCRQTKLKIEATKVITVKSHVRRDRRVDNDCTLITAAVKIIRLLHIGIGNRSFLSIELSLLHLQFHL